MRTPLLLACWLAGAPATLLAAPAVTEALPGMPPAASAAMMPQSAMPAGLPVDGGGRVAFGSARPMTLPRVAVVPGMARALAPARPGQAPVLLVRAAADAGASGPVAAQGERQATTMGTDTPAPGGTLDDGATPAMPGPAADNTGRNQTHDRRIEAEDQSNNRAEVAVVRQIRRALVDDDSLSMDAHNAKVIVSGSRVILRGPVASAAERQKVEGIVRKSAGTRQIVNELEVAPR